VGGTMTLFKDSYRIESSRLKGWDYSAAGCYFVTICTRDQECWLGNVVDGVMRLSPAGEIVAEEWQKTAAIRENVSLDEWVVMPNHVHGIIIINGEEKPRREVPYRETCQWETPHRGVSTNI
jgi:putative transposase